MAYKQKNFFEFRDSLPKGEPDKVIKGMHFDEEFAAIEDAFGKVTGDIELDGKPLPELLDEKANQVDLEQEIKDRIEGDKNLQDQIDNLEPYDDTQIKEDISNLDDKIDQEILDRIEGDKLLQGNIDDLADDLAQEIVDRQEGDSNLNTKIDNLATDDLTDVNSENASKDQFLIHNGVQWVAEDFHIDTELQFQGGISVPNEPAPAANNGDLYINNEDGVAGASWTGIAGRTINAANAVGWSSKNNRWYMLGDIASAAVLRVEPGTGIDVEDSKPAEPVVSIDRTEVDKWYEPPISPKYTAFNKNFGTTSGTVAEGDHDHDSDYADINHDHSGVYEPVITPKNSAFNKNFGTANGEVARGDHTHSQYLTGFTETDPTVPQHVKNITTTQISNWDTAYSWGNHATQGYLKSGDVPGVDLTGYATETWVSNGFEPKFGKNSAFNKTFGTTAGTVSEGNHTHSQYLTGFTETDPTVPAHVKGITQADINKWNNPPSGGGLPDGDWICEGSIYAKGNVTAFWTSDENKKTDIGPMPLGLIDGINPVTFKWKESGKSSGGVIAQQLQACGLEDWVNEAPDGTLGVDYMALIGVLLAEVQDLKLRVKELEG